MKNHFEPPPKDLLQVQCSKGFNLRLQRSDFYSVAAGLRQMMATTSAIDAVEHIAVTTSRANIGAWSSQTQIRQRSCGHRWTGHDRHGRHRRHCCRHRRRKSRTEKGRTGCEWLFEGIWELQHREVRGFWPWRSHQVLLSWTLDFISYTFWLKTTSKEQKSKKSVLQFTQYMYRLHIYKYTYTHLFNVVVCCWSVYSNSNKTVLWCSMTHMTHMSCLFYAANECCEPQEMKQLHGPQICKFAGDS